MSSFSLDVLRADPDFASLFGKRKDEVKQNKANLLEAASHFQSKYASEIEDGTKTRQLLLEAGKSKGLSEEETFRDNQIFIPTMNTPILNMLFFLLREQGDLSANVTVLREAKYLGKDHEELREELDALHGSELHEVVAMAEALPNAKGFIYGKVGSEGFNVLKKLKTLASSKNEAEAFVAYRKARQICEKIGVDFDKVPINN
jgi:hypothetical protein